MRNAKQNSSSGAKVTERVARHGVIKFEKRIKAAAVALIVCVGEYYVIVLIGSWLDE